MCVWVHMHACVHVCVCSCTLRHGSVSCPPAGGGSGGRGRVGGLAGTCPPQWALLGRTSRFPICQPINQRRTDRDGNGLCRGCACNPSLRTPL